MSHDRYPQRVNEDLIHDGVRLRELVSADTSDKGFVAQAAFDDGGNSGLSIATFSQQPGERHPIVASIQATILHDPGIGRTGEPAFCLKDQPEIVSPREAMGLIPLGHAARTLDALSSLVVTDRIGEDYGHTGI